MFLFVKCYSLSFSCSNEILNISQYHNNILCLCEKKCDSLLLKYPGYIMIILVKKFALNLLGGWKIFQTHYCSSLLHYQRLQRNDFPCRTQEGEN